MQAVIDILNSDIEARKLHAAFERKAKEHGLERGTKEYQQAEQVMLMLHIHRNNEAISILAEETYRQLNEPVE